jgi:predicted secreted protein
MPRVDLLEIELVTKHETFGAKGKYYWYIKAVATDPDAQDKGYIRVNRDENAGGSLG